MQPFSTHTGMSTAVDTRGLSQDHVSKRMRVELAGGESLEARLHELTVCERPEEPCCGITYVLLSSNRSDGKKDIGSAYWMAFGEIEKFEVLGD